MSLKYEIMQYQDNKTATVLGYLSLLMNTIFLIMALNIVTPDFFIGVKILLNIMNMLMILLFSEEAKRYIKSSGYKLMVVGLIAFMRVLWIPRKVLEMTEVTRSTGYFLITLLVLEGLLLIFSGFIVIQKCNGISRNLETMERKHGKTETR